MRPQLRSTFLAAAALSLSLVSACSDKFADCEEEKSCIDASGGSDPTSGDGDGERHAIMASGTFKTSS